MSENTYSPSSITMTTTTPPPRRYTFIPHKFFLYWLSKYRRQVSERLGRFIKKRTYHVHMVSFCQRLIQNENNLPEGWNEALDPLRRIGLTDIVTVSTFLKYNQSWEHEHQLPALREKYLQAMDELKSIQRSPDPPPYKIKYRSYYDDDEQLLKVERLQNAQKQVEYYFDKITSLPIYPSDLHFSKKKFIEMKSIVDHAMPQIVAAFTQHVQERMIPLEQDSFQQREEPVVAAVQEETSKDIESHETTYSSVLPCNDQDELQNLANCISQSLKNKKWKIQAMQQFAKLANTNGEDLIPNKKVYQHTVAHWYRQIRHKPQEYSGVLDILRTVGLAKREVGSRYFETLRNKERFEQVKEQIRQLESDVKKLQEEHTLACQDLTEQTKQLESFRDEYLYSSGNNDQNDKRTLDLRAKIFQDKIAAAKSQIHERNMAIGYLYQSKLSMLHSLKNVLNPPSLEEESQAIENALDEVMPGILEKFVVSLMERLDQENIQQKAATDKQELSARS